MTEDELEVVMAALRPVIAEAVTAAVGEAVKRIALVEPVEGVVEAVTGRTADVRIPGAPLVVPATALSPDIVAGSGVVVFFYTRGRAFCSGPLAMP